jgi:hypothetical protein
VKENEHWFVNIFLLFIKIKYLILRLKTLLFLLYDLHGVKSIQRGYFKGKNVIEKEIILIFLFVYRPHTKEFMIHCIPLWLFEVVSYFFL